MKYSNFFIPTFRENPSDAKLKSHVLMIKSGMIKQETSGIYSWLPLGFKVLKKIIKIIEEMHDSHGINQILMPTIQGSDIWKISNRYDTYGKEMLRIIDRNNKELLYGPTNEEMITAIGKFFIKSHKTLPRYFFQIQSKFRDEIRPRFGVMRAREFLMKDAYSFDKDEKSGELTYENFFRLYLNIFEKLGLKIIPVRAPSGEIGGSLSHEFHLLIETGESKIFIDEVFLKSNFSKLKISEIKSMNSFTDELYESLNISQNLRQLKSTELGHIFLFGTKYSKSFDFKIDHENNKTFPFMGSYGIGISRIPAAIIEASNDKNGIVWPKEVSPFDIVLINLTSDNSITKTFCEELYNDLKKNNYDVLFDDRSERPGIKFSDADLIGIPIQIIVGRNFIDNKEIGVKTRKDLSESIISSDNIIKFLKNLKI
ncbi:MAG: proline--tRNA ligase [Rickettsiales bacterium]|nr:proline--tRNA ligase [Rickettsiales bacterium]|tara:strand:+ start:175 stop:1455 length:1281 start_codon:yes stop_codon:yes gene_type:complete